MRKSFDPSLYLVTDRSLSRNRQITEIVRQAAEGGVSMVQLREKDASTQDFLQLARELKALLAPRGIPLIINDRMDIALASGADGVHVGQRDMPVEEIRRLMGPDAIIGLSVESGEDAEKANALDIDYIGISPVHVTPTKKELTRGLGLSGVREIVSRSRFPSVGIGGIHKENAGEIIRAGADGVAVVSAICSADDPCLASSELAETVSSAKTGRRYSRVLSIAGSDSSGGAGIQADLKTFSALGCYGMSAITAVTAQNTMGVRGIHPIPLEILEAQIRSVLDDIGTDAVKIGMLHSSELILSITKLLEEYGIKKIVLDPVMVATSGDLLLQPDAVETLKEVLIPKASLITPNIPEAEILLGRSLPCQCDLPQAARDLTDLGCPAVLLKAGHLRERELVDCYYDTESGCFTELPSDRLDTKNTHGTGCTLSSAVASYLARGVPTGEAVRSAKSYLTGAIEKGSRYTIGHGHGPVHHFHEIWR